MRTQYQSAVIFSVYQNGLSDEDNRFNFLKASAKLIDLTIPHRVLNGRYNGIDEKSFYIHSDYIEFALALASTYNQETVLTLDQDWNAGLVNVKTGEKRLIGEFRQASEAIAKSKDAFTHDPVDDRYFIVN